MTIPYFTQIGTIYLTVLREKLANYNKIYTTTPNADEEFNTIQVLKDKIKVFTYLGQQMYTNATAWRSELFGFLIGNKYG